MVDVRQAWPAGRFKGTTMEKQVLLSVFLFLMIGCSAKDAPRTTASPTANAAASFTPYSISPVASPTSAAPNNIALKHATVTREYREVGGLWGRHYVLSIRETGEVT